MWICKSETKWLSAPVSNSAPEGATVLESSAPTPTKHTRTANQGHNRHTRNFQAGLLRKVGAELCRTEFGHPWPSVIYPTG